MYICPQFVYTPENILTIHRGEVLEGIETVEFKKVQRTLGITRHRRGTCKWNLIQLNSAAIYIRADDCERCNMNFYSEGNQPVYSMVESLELNSYREALSLVLGLGNLAYAAAEYKGHQNVYRKIKWKKDKQSLL